MPFVLPAYSHAEANYALRIPYLERNEVDLLRF